MGKAKLQCDFCSALRPVWRYPARNFVAYRVSYVAGESVGDWIACDGCHALIEGSDLPALAQRSLENLLAKHPEARAAADILFNELRDLHQQFFRNRLGPAVPIFGDV